MAPHCSRAWPRRGEKEADGQLLIQTEHRIPVWVRTTGSGGRELRWARWDGAISGYRAVVKPAAAAASRTKRSLLLGCKLKYQHPLIMHKKIYKASSSKVLLLIAPNVSESLNYSWLQFSGVSWLRKIRRIGYEYLISHSFSVAQSKEQGCILHVRSTENACIC